MTRPAVAAAAGQSVKANKENRRKEKSRLTRQTSDSCVTRMQMKLEFQSVAPTTIMSFRSKVNEKWREKFDLLPFSTFDF